METLSDVYEELNYLHLKYQYLREVCRSLLKKWPAHTPAGKPLKEKKTDTRLVDKRDVQSHDHSIRSSKTLECKVSDSPTTDEVPSNLDELTQLDDILERAQKIRLSQNGTNGKRTTKSTRLSSKSAKLASQVYGVETKKTSKPVVSQPMKRTKSLSNSKDIASSSSSTKRDRQRARLSKNSVDSTTKLLMKSRPGREDKSALKDFEDNSRLLKTKSSVPEIQSSQHYANKDRTTRTVSLPACDDRRSSEAVCSGCSSSVSQQGEADETLNFDIQLHGTRLTIPSKYCQLHRTLTRLNDELKQESTPSGHDHQSHPAGDYFTRRLNRKSKELMELIQLHLTRDEYDDVKEMFLSMTPQEWTVSERSAWQEILKVKLKLDAILEHAQMLQNSEVPLPTPITLTTCAATPSAFSREMPFCYASLEEWQSIAVCGHQQHWLSSQKQILKFLIEELIPHISLMKEETSDSIHIFTAMVRAVYELAGIESKPVYIRTDDN